MHRLIASAGTKSRTEWERAQLSPPKPSLAWAAATCCSPAAHPTSPVFPFRQAVGGGTKSEARTPSPNPKAPPPGRERPPSTTPAVSLTYGRSQQQHREPATHTHRPSMAGQPTRAAPFSKQQKMDPFHGRLFLSRRKPFPVTFPQEPPVTMTTIRTPFTQEPCAQTEDDVGTAKQQKF